PLLNATLPDWMLLHFQTAASAGWGSPQVLPPSYLDLLNRNEVSLTNCTEPRKELLAEITRAETSQMLLTQVQQQELQLDASQEFPLEQAPGLLLNPGNNEKNANFSPNLAQANANVRNFTQQPQQPQLWQLRQLEY